MKKLIIIAILSLYGCASTGTQISQSTATSFKEGQSTEAEIRNRLGTPTSVMLMGDIKMLSYAGSQFSIKPATFIPIVGIFAGGSNYASTSVIYQIDKTGLLQKITYMSSGLATQNGTNLVDTPKAQPTAVP